MKMLIAGLMCLTVVGFSGHAMALSVNPTNDATILTNTILGSGITRDGTPTHTGAAGAAGTFTGGYTSGIGIDAGIILTTGAAVDAAGPNTAGDTTTQNFLPGDPHLSVLAGFLTFDATVLEFSFDTEGGNLFFNYVFASEEYSEYVNLPFNDMFGIFLDGTNIALIPGTTDPVAINTVNGGNPLGSNASNPDLFNDNAFQDNAASPFDLEYDGFTDVFTATATNLAPGTHSIRLAIADTGDFDLDSAVFIQAGTFSDQVTSALPPTAPMPEPSTWMLLGTGLLALVGHARRRQRQRV